MKMKNKSRLIVVIGILFLSSFFGASDVQAGASATVSWTAPTTNQDGSTPVDVTGYRVYYSTSSLWPNVIGDCLIQSGSSAEVTGGTTTSHKFINTLSPGATYYFTVVAVDGSNNISRCASIPGGGATQVNKRVTYSADFNDSKSVDMFDYVILRNNYGRSGAVATGDANRSGAIDMFDYTILRGDYGRSFI